MKRKQYVKDLKMGDRVESQFLVTGKRYLNFKRASGKYLALTLADRTGEIQAKVWDQAEAKGRGFRSGRVAHVTGEVVIFNEVLEIHVTDITETQDYQNDDFVVIDELRISELAAELRDIVALLEPGPCQRLAELFLQSQWFAPYCHSPAAQTIHHNYPGGLLEHSLGVMKICQMVGSQRKEINTDLLVTGALLHDVGKIREMNLAPGIQYTDEGKLLGHIVLGIEMVGELIKSSGIGDQEFRNRILHMIASHHGEYEWQSPKRPKFIEARVLHLADMMDADIYKFENAVPEEEGSRWSAYLPRIGNRVFLGSD
jgi:3'-5' exoribonuclease